MFEGKKILITGGTGSLGSALTKRLLKTGVETIRIFSRDEWKQVQMEQELKDSRLRFLIGDIRDKERISRALEEVDILIHAAALKHVPIIEYNPFEAVKTNVNGAQNIIESCLDRDVEVALAVGTDKAVSPFNTYGASKFLMERLFVAANNMKGTHRTKFLCVRYGNVLGSRGSVLPLFLNQIKKGDKITVTDPTMTRFTITMNQSVDLIFRALQKGIGGEIFVPKLKAYRVGDFKEALLELLDAKNETELISVRPGEKYHESLISADELRNNFETDEDYVLIDKNNPNYIHNNFVNIKSSSLTEHYSSDTVELLDKNELKEILIKEKLV